MIPLGSETRAITQTSENLKEANKVIKEFAFSVLHNSDEGTRQYYIAGYLCQKNAHHHNLNVCLLLIINSCFVRFE